MEAMSGLARFCETAVNAKQEWIRDVFTFNTRNCDLEWSLLSVTVNPVDALNQVIMDEKRYFNHQKLTNLTRANNSSNYNGKMNKNFDPVKENQD